MESFFHKKTADLFSYVVILIICLNSGQPASCSEIFKRPLGQRPQGHFAVDALESPNHKHCYWPLNPHAICFVWYGHSGQSFRPASGEPATQQVKGYGQQLFGGNNYHSHKSISMRCRRYSRMRFRRKQKNDTCSYLLLLANASLACRKEDKIRKVNMMFKRSLKLSEIFYRYLALLHVWQELSSKVVLLLGADGLAPLALYPNKLFPLTGHFRKEAHPGHLGYRIMHTQPAEQQGGVGEPVAGNHLTEAQPVKQENSYHARRLKWFFTYVFILTASFAVLLVLYIRSRRSHRRLQRQNRQLEQSNDFKSKIFSIVGHDVSGIISSMSAILYILREENLEKAEQQEFAVQLTELKDQALETLNKLFLWGTAESALSRKKPLLIPNALKATLDLAATGAGTRGLVVEVQEMAAEPVLADQDNLEFIVRNLLSNALKFAEAHSTIKVDFSRTDKELLINISNKGMPMSKTQIQHIFQNNMDHSGEGKGTGLMLCKRIADAEGYGLELVKSDATCTVFRLSLKRMMEP